MSRRIILCADDYGLSPGVSLAIRDLIARRRINATSVMMLFPDRVEEAGRLDIVAQDTGVSIGLHVTLTGGFAPLAAAPLGGERLPSLGQLLAAAMLRGIDTRAIAAEVTAQFQAFEAAYGRAPDHVDGHQHAHVLPMVRAVVLDIAAQRAPGALLRDCTQAPRARLGLDLKGRLISRLSAGLASQAGARGLRVNRGFAGAYDFSPGTDFAALLAHCAGGLDDGGLMMVHPGHVDEILRGRDRVHEAREMEYGVLAGADAPALLAKAGVTLA
ncbi:MAG: ChbG/HpnK family deacetylase [Pseudomonadota bacterium]